MSGRTITITFGGNSAGVRRAAGEASRAIGSVQSSVGRVARSVGAVAALGSAMAVTSAYGLALGSSLAGVAGAAALIPAGVAAGVAALVAAKVVTAGLGEAWQATGQKAVGGGGSTVNVGRQVAAAQRQVKAATDALTGAQRTARDAQEALTAARAGEVKRLRDLSLSVRSARADQADAAASAAQAELELAAAEKAGDPAAIEAARRQYEQAQIAVAEVTNRLTDLSAEQTKATQSGVEGSDAVQAALRQQEDAQKGVEDAAQRLAEAQDAVRQASVKTVAGGINPATEALNKLAPNARSLIVTLRGLVPAWQAAGRAGQQNTFAGTASLAQKLSGIYLPLVASWLLRMGAAFNVAIRQAGGLATSAGFVKTIGALLDATATSTARLALAVRPVVSGIAAFVAVGVGFLPGIAGNVLVIAQRFEAWATAARASGAAQGWIAKALATLSQVKQIGADVVATVLAVVHAGGDGGSTLDALVRGADAMRAWVTSAQGQQTIADVLARIRDVMGQVGQIVPVVAGNADGFNDALNVTGAVVGFAADHLDTLAKLLPVLAAGFVISKVAQVGANVAAVVGIPLKTAEVAATWGLKAALRAQTTALIENTAISKGATGAQVAETAAQNGGILARGRAIVAMAAQKIATVAGTIATWAATAATTAFGIAVTVATGPIGLAILAVAVFVAGIILLWTKCETFRTIVIAVFNAVWTAIKFVWNWIKGNWPLLLAILTGPIGIAVLAIVKYWDKIKAGVSAVKDWIVARFNDVASFVGGLPGRLGKLADGIRSVLIAPFKAAFNAISALWNGTVGKLSFSVPGWVPGIGGRSFSLPKLPQLQHGGPAVAGRSYLVGERGPEVLTMGSQSGHVTPNSALGGDIVIPIQIGDEVVRVVRVTQAEQNRQLKRRALAGAGRLATGMR
jgi:hypothetical protein